MEYILVLDYDSKCHYTYEDENGFVEKFGTFEKADEEGRSLLVNGDCDSYEVFKLINKKS